MMYTGMSNVKSQILSIYRGKSWNFNFRETVFIIEFEEIICFTVGGSTEGSGGWYSNQRSNYCGGRSVQEKSRIGSNTLLSSLQGYHYKEGREYIQSNVNKI